MQRRKNNVSKRNKKIVKRKPLHEFMHGLLKSSRGFLMKSRQKFFVIADFKFVAGGATVLLPYTYNYINLSNPLKANGGAATNVWYWSVVSALMRKYLITHIIVQADLESQELFGTIPFLGPANYLPANTVVEAQTTIQSPLTVTKIMAGVGSMNRAHLEISVDLLKLGGFDPLNSEDVHWGGLNPVADPGDNMYATLIVDTNGAASASGILVNVRVGFYGIAAEMGKSL